jgi:hypothetical protein
MDDDENVQNEVEYTDHVRKASPRGCSIEKLEQSVKSHNAVKPEFWVVDTSDEIENVGREYTYHISYKHGGGHVVFAELFGVSN